MPADIRFRDAMFGAENRYRLETLALLAAYCLTSLPVSMWPNIESLRGHFALFAGSLLLFVAVCGGWPLSYPLGEPRYGPLVSASIMTLVILTSSLALSAACALVGMDRFALGAWLVAISAVWGLAFEAWPLRHFSPRRAALMGIPATLALTSAASVVTSSVTPGSYLPLLLISLVAVFALSPSVCFQGWPFHSLWRQPRIGLAILLTGVLSGLGLSVLPGSPLLNGGEEAKLAVEVSSGLVLWLPVLSWGMLYPFGLRKRQPIRGLITITLAISATLPWTLLLRLLSVDVLTVNLLLVLPLYVLHTTVWLRAPLRRHVLPSMLAQGQETVEKLLEWRLQVSD